MTSMMVFVCGSRAVEQMIIHRPDLINFTKKDGYSPLHVAAANNRVHIADFLAQQVCTMRMYDFSHTCMLSISPIW